MSSVDTNYLTILHILLNIAKITTFWLKMRVPSSVTESGLKHIPEIRDFGIRDQSLNPEIPKSRGTLSRVPKVGIRDRDFGTFGTPEIPTL